MDVSIVLCEYLMLDGLNIHEKFKYLIQSIDGDQYYLTDMLVEDDYISEELGWDVYECIQDLSCKDIMLLYAYLVQDEMEEEIK